MSAEYRFIPWVRAGMAAAVGGSSGARVSVPVSLSINSQPPAVNMEVRLYGPGDVIGLDLRQLVRTEPTHRTSDFEPNYFPLVEFDRPDLPWLFSPAIPDADRGRLQPWLCLVVVRRQDGVTLRHEPRRPLPTLLIEFPARPQDELPELAEAWAWVHAQVVEDGTETRPLQERLPDELAADSIRNLSRLLCPRRLDPQTAYLACVVPTFEVGRKAGMGLPMLSEEENDPAPAWQGAPERVELPVYHHFEFSTGVGGDFESLVERLKHRRLPPQVGRRTMAIGDLGFGIAGLEREWLSGALRPPNTLAAPLPMDFRNALRTLLKRPAERLPGQSPLLAPPLYGRWQAREERLPDGGDAPGWLETLNLDPRHRAAAGFGTLIVQDQQEDLMASAWAQIADTPRANQHLRQAQLALQAGQSLHRRHLATMPPDRLLQVAGPVLTQMQTTTDTGETLSIMASSLRDGGVPDAITSVALRRVTRPRSPLVRRLHPTAPVSLTQGLFQATATPVPGPDPGRLAANALQEPLTRLRGVAAASGPADNLLPALNTLHSYLRDTQSPPPAASVFSLAAQDIPEEQQSGLLAALQPAVTVTARLNARIRPVTETLTIAHAAAAPVVTIPELEPLRMPAPTFPRPMYETLRDFSQELLLPGLEHVPQETVTLLETNPEFVEAFMVGLNHEMGRELLWRGYPTDQRGTYFRSFWAAAGTTTEGVQLPAIHEWPLATPLGGNFMAEDADAQLVLLIRGELLRRYPGAVIYAARAASPTALDQQAPPLFPLFRGTLEPGVTFLGFRLTAEAAVTPPGYFFVIEQQPTEPCFGLDVPESFDTPLPPLTAWANLSWRYFASDQDTLQSLHYLPVENAAVPVETTLDGIAWGRNAAHLAAITLQPPVRIAIHAGAFLKAPATL